ncbi:MAG: winged helix-turn-helix transcriptional regulator [Bacteroidales bacterium]|nr:winged helix-turn-helix transcriptional regulator [Bacteroidales bacterium]
MIKNKKLTRATELLFGLHHTNIHIGRFKTQTIIIDDLMIRSPLILAVDEAIDFIKKNIRLAFEIGGETTQRKERWQYPIPAIRELLLNAIVHRDYTDPTDVIIKIFDEEIEITNPGKLLGGLTIEKILSGNYVPKHRNKLIVESFYLTGDIEKYGTGFRRVKEWFKDYPELKYKILDLKDFIQIKIFNVTENVTENIILKEIENNNKITTNELAKRLNLTRRTIARYISNLKEQDVLKRIGPDKGGYWKIINDEK